MVGHTEEKSSCLVAQSCSVQLLLQEIQNVGIRCNLVFFRIFD